MHVELHSPKVSLASMLSEAALKNEGRLFAMPPLAAEFANLTRRLAQGPLPAILAELYKGSRTPVDLHYLELLSTPPGADATILHVDEESSAAMELQLLLRNLEGDGGLLEAMPGCFIPSLDWEVDLNYARRCVHACEDQLDCRMGSIAQPREAGAAVLYLSSLLHSARNSTQSASPVPQRGHLSRDRGPEPKIALVAEFGARHLLPEGARNGHNYLQGRYKPEHIDTINLARAAEWSALWHSSGSARDSFLVGARA